jgi:hypothetical protein
LFAPSKTDEDPAEQVTTAQRRYKRPFFKRRPIPGVADLRRSPKAAMPYDIFFAGVGATILGTLIGAWIAPKLMYPYQKKLLDQQLDFQKRQAEADALQRERISQETTKAIGEVRHMLNLAQQKLGSLNLNLAGSRVREAQAKDQGP